jgi:hypothetical protein
MNVSIQHVSGSKFTGIVRPTPTKTGPVLGNFSDPNTITVTQFGDANGGSADVLRRVSDRCDVGSAGVSALSGSLSDTTKLILTGTVTTACHYPSGTYASLVSLTVNVFKQFDEVFFTQQHL